MSTKIKNLPQLRVDEIRGYLKVPTGGMGDVSVTVQGIVDWIISVKVFATLEDFNKHINNKSNPHNVTKQQIGLGNVDNTSDLDKPISNAQNIVNNSLNNEIANHTRNKLNPHNVTKQQIGLGNVDNTSDLDKPISKDTKEYIDDKIYGAGNKYSNSYATYDEALTHKDEWEVNSSILITNDGEKSGLYLWDGNELIKSDYDPLLHSKQYTDNQILYYREVKYDFHGESNDNQNGSITVGSDGNITEYTNSYIKELDFYTGDPSQEDNLEIDLNGLKIKSNEKPETFEKHKNDVVLSCDTLKLRSPHTPVDLMYDDNYYMINAQYIYDFYDELMDHEPTYISKTDYGEDDVGNKIYAYSFTPPPIRTTGESFTNPSYAKKTKILIFDGIHGSERVAMLTGMRFFYNLVHNSNKIDGYSKIRSSIDFVVVPVLCPSGRNLARRSNSNGVDLNRNFPTGWDEAADREGTVFWKGQYPLSEPECRIAINIALDHSDSICNLSLHGHGLGTQLFWLGSNTEWVLRLSTKILNNINSVFYDNQSTMQDKINTLTYLSSNNRNGLDGFLQERYKIPCMLLEFGTGLQYFKTQYAMNIFNERLLYESINELYELDHNNRIMLDYLKDR